VSEGPRSPLRRALGSRDLGRGRVAKYEEADEGGEEKNDGELTNNEAMREGQTANWIWLARISGGAFAGHKYAGGGQALDAIRFVTGNRPWPSQCLVLAEPTEGQVMKKLPFCYRCKISESRTRRRTDALRHLWVE